MENIIDRLVKYMEFRKLNPNKITTDAKLSVGLIGKSIQAKKGLHSETIEKILLAYTELSSDWFVIGRGEMLRQNELNKFAETENVLQKVAEPENEYILNFLKEQVAELKKDKEELKKDKALLTSLIETKLGNQEAS